MAFESGFGVGASLPMVEHPLSGLMERIAGGYKTGAEMAAMPQQQELMQALRRAQAEQAQAQAGLQTQQAREKQFVGDYLQKYLSGQQGAPSPVSGSMGDALARKLAGLPEETPQEKQAREIETARLKAEQSKELEKVYGTQSHITTLQDKLSGIESTLPFVEDLIKMDLPSKLTPAGTTGHKQFQSTIKQAAEQYIKAKGLGTGQETLNQILDVFTRGGAEFQGGYRERMRKLKADLLKDRAELKKGLSVAKESSADVTENDPLGIR